MSLSSERIAWFFIADLSGYTALTESHGDEHAADVVTQYGSIVDSVVDPPVRCIERFGDEALIVSPEAATAIQTAVRLRQAAEQQPLFPTIRIGVHGGAVIERGGSYFGAVLNVTARVAAHARGGQILCTVAVASAASGLTGVEFRSIGPVRFRNVADPIEIFEILTTSGGISEAIEIDPVCRMQVKPETAPARLRFGGYSYHFCSLTCAKKFTEEPERYLPRG